jgi:hypothetical protein
MATVADLQEYKKEDGFYDIQAIVLDEGKSGLAATFAAFFGGEDVDAEEASELVLLARSENERLAEEQAAVYEVEAEAAYQRVLAGQGTNEDNRLLVHVGWARNNYEEVDSNRPTSITITRHNPPGNQYADQAGIEEIPLGR